jgi:hypothetical protein
MRPVFEKELEANVWDPYIKLTCAPIEKPANGEASHQPVAGPGKNLKKNSTTTPGRLYLGKKRVYLC